MIEEIVTAVEPGKTKKTYENEALTLHLGEDAAAYVTDERTRQKLLDLVTAKIYASSTPKATGGISIKGVLFLLFIVFVVGAVVVTKNKSNGGSEGNA